MSGPQELPHLPGLDVRVVPVPPLGEPLPADLTSWMDTMSLAFRQGRMDEAHRDHWLEHLRADDVRLVGAWPDPPAWGAGADPVATTASFGKRLHVGGGRDLPAHLVTDVTVTASHRRRGLMAALLTAELRQAVARQRPVALLTASEGAIYQRFGFGPATRLRTLEVDVRGGLAVHDPVAGPDDAGPGAATAVVVAPPAEAWPAVEALWRRARPLARGSVDRPEFVRPGLDGSFDWEHGGPRRELQTALHLEDGVPTGYAAYRHDGEADGVPRVRLVDLVWTTPAAERGLWRHLGSLDLAQRVHWNRAPVAGSLDWLLVDPRRARTTGVRDHLWVRLLDAATALEARPWAGSGSVALDVDDPLGHVDGGWRVDVVDGHASVSTVPRERPGAPVVRLDASVLGSWYLGDVTVPTLAAAGRLAGSQEALAALAALGDGGPLPYCTTGF